MVRGITPERYQRLAEVFAATCELPPAGRARSLEVACGGDPVLRAQAEDLLAHDDDSDRFLENSSFTFASALQKGTRRFADDDPLHPGDSFGRYRVVRRLGEGGQGTVYLAEDDRLGRTVALKVLSFGGRIHPRFLARFKREARAAGRLGHPGLCTVHTADVEDGLPYIAMQYVEGETLAARIRTARDSGQTPGWRSWVATVEQVALAVHAAHEAGVVHRDLKPGNIMITPEGEPVVLDFGLALDERGGPALTEQGEVFGTPAYMAPEQIEGALGFADRRTDVYALGVILYECLTLRRPFDADSRHALYRQILAGQYPDPRRVDRAIPGPLRTVLATAMATEQDHRYQTAHDLAEDLRRARERLPIRAKRAGPLRRLAAWARRDPGLALTAAGILLVLAAGLALTGVLLHRTNTSLAESRRLTDVMMLDHLKRSAGEELWPVLPGTVPAISDWLEEAASLVDRRGVHERYLQSVQRRRRRDGAELGDEDLALAAGFVKELSELPTLMATVRARRAAAAAIKGRTVDDFRDAWNATIEAIAADPRYGGLRIEPQVGLVPLGRDPDSGLFEFGHPQTGKVPSRDAVDRSIRPFEQMGLVFVLVPGGSFRMGHDAPGLEDDFYVGHDGRRHRIYQLEELPAHRVHLDPFFISKYEMTQAQWMQLAGSNPSHASPGCDCRELTFTLLHPVENVGWHECVELLGRYGLILPTEAQWEYAARAGTRTIWWTGNDMESLLGAANLADQSVARHGQYWDAIKSWPELDDGWPWHAPVGRFRANPFGLHDVHGNVWEMVQDYRHSYEHPVRPGDGLRMAPPEALTWNLGHVSRGGACELDAWYARSSRRYGAGPFFACGLRPARAICGESVMEAGP